MPISGPPGDALVSPGATAALIITGHDTASVSTAMRCIRAYSSMATISSATCVGGAPTKGRAFSMTASNLPWAALTPPQLETARRDLTELTGGDWFAQAAAWAGPLLATVGVLQTELARAERTIQDYHAAYRTRTDERDLA